MTKPDLQRPDRAMVSCRVCHRLEVVYVWSPLYDQRLCARHYER